MAIGTQSQWRGPFIFDDVGSKCWGCQGLCQSKVEIARWLLRAIQKPYVAEIGVDHGTFVLPLLQQMPNIQVLGVDPYDCSKVCYPGTDKAYDFVHDRAAEFRDR